jgi:hypothetical protein
MGTL